MSRMYFLCSSRSSCVSGIGAGRSPLSTTEYPRPMSRSPSPAMRKAEGPMSTPRRPPPRSKGTPMMWTVGTTRASLFKLKGNRHTLAGRRDDRRHHTGVVLNGPEKVRHLAALVDHIVGEKDPACPRTREHQIE